MQSKLFDTDFFVISGARPEKDRTYELEEDLGKLGIPYIRATGQWHGTLEASFIIPRDSVTIKEITAIATIFEQEAILSYDARSKSGVLLSMNGSALDLGTLRILDSPGNADCTILRDGSGFTFDNN